MPILNQSSGCDPSEIRPIIRSLESDDDIKAFRALNEEWISRYFVLEAKDRELLSDPRAYILDGGGQIFLACLHDSPIGCLALISIGDGMYELSKMAVSPEFRGSGIGRALLNHAIESARTLRAKSLFLASNSMLQNAVHLYESVGFKHLPDEKIPPTPYARANVFMEMPL